MYSDAVDHLEQALAIFLAADDKDLAQDTNALITKTVLTIQARKAALTKEMRNA